jgi:hypothetical protein
LEKLVDFTILSFLRHEMDLEQLWQILDNVPYRPTWWNWSEWGNGPDP